MLPVSLTIRFICSNEALGMSAGIEEGGTATMEAGSLSGCGLAHCLPCPHQRHLILRKGTENTLGMIIMNY